MKQIHIFTVFETAISFFDGQFKYLTDCGDDIILITSNHQKAEEFSIKNNVRFVPVEMPRAIAPRAILKAIYSIYKLIKQEKPNVVFGHTPVGALCAMIAAKCCGIKNRVYYRHGIIYTTMKGIKYLIFLMEEKFVASLATAVINVSHSLSKVAIKDNLNPAYKNNVIGHGTCGGIDAINIFNPNLIKEVELEKRRNDLGLENKQDIVFGFCGRLCKDKGVPEMVDAFLKFQAIHTNLSSRLVLIGDFDVRDSLSDSVKEIIRENSNIIVTGRIDKSIIPYYYYMLDVFIFPSYREGFGMCVLEASAMQKPILVSRSHGCEDSIIEHYTGEYIELTADSICEGMEKMLDKEWRNFLGSNGRKTVLKYYDNTVMWPLVSDLYKKILK